MPIEMPRGLPFSVDTWSPNSKLKRHHFLTHAHKDHCSGITSHFSFPIYSTHLTKSLILCYFPQLDDSLFVGIEVGQSITINDPDGSFIVTAFDANHCPGAVMFLFEGDFGNILHTGDCRLTPECLQNLPEKYIARSGKEPSCQLDFVFLDCTFGKSLMKIPSTQSAIQQVINCIWKHPDARKVYLTCDVLGQEEILVHVYQTFGSKIYVDKGDHPDFYQALQLIAPQILSEDPSSRFHLFEGFPKLYEKARKKLLEARDNMQPEPLIIRPSAQWYAREETELTVMERKILERSNIPVKDQFGVWHVCYSRHSSRQELEWALQLLAPKWVVSTTPECRAMELEYVKKRCFSAQASSDDRFWKLLDINVEASPRADVLVEESSSSCIMETAIVALEESELQLPEMLTNKSGQLKLSPLKKKSPITLFGRARLGYHSCILAEEMKTESGKAGSRYSVINEVEKKLPPSDDNVENQAEKSTESEINVDAAEKELDKLTPPVCCKSVSYSSIGSTNGYGDSLRKLYRSDDNVQNQAEKPTESEIEVDAAEIESDKLKPPVACKSVSYSSIGSTNGYNDSLRKLYRSMNAPVPQPLPSLVGLMKANKRARRRFEF